MKEKMRLRRSAALGIALAALIALAAWPLSALAAVAPSAAPVAAPSAAPEAVPSAAPEAVPSAAPAAGSGVPAQSTAPSESAGGVPDLSQGGWIRQRIEAVAALYDCDFVLNEACVYSKDSGRLTLTYATRASIEDVRNYYRALMADCVEAGVNDAGNLNLSGTAGGRALTVRNYYSEVTNLIELKLAEDGAKLLDAVRAGFPEAVFAANGAFSEALEGASESGYVLYTYDEYDDRFIPGAPVFSRAYCVGHAVEAVELEDQGALLAMEPAQADGKPVAVLLYQAESASQGA